MGLARYGGVSSFHLTTVVAHAAGKERAAFEAAARRALCVSGESRQYQTQRVPVMHHAKIKRNAARRMRDAYAHTMCVCCVYPAARLASNRCRRMPMKEGVTCDTEKEEEKKKKKKKSLTCDIKSVMCAKKKEAEQTSGRMGRGGKLPHARVML